MKFSSFFIDRPIFAVVLSLLIVVGRRAGAARGCRSASIPSVVPPTVVVRGVYPGANPKVIAETVASPLEQQMNGVEGMLYMFSQATSDGALTLTVTFALGTDLDNAQVQVQNRVAQALPRLPQDVQRIGVTTEKASPDFMHGRAPRVARRALRHALPVELRAPAGQGRTGAHRRRRRASRSSAPANTACASGSIPDGWPSRQLTATDVVRAIREQNVQVAAGVLGAPPAPSDATFQLSINTQGRLTTEEEFGEHRRPRHARRPDHAAARRRPRRARLEHVLAAQPARQQAGGGDRHLPAARHQRARGVGRRARDDGAAEADVSRRASTTASSTTRRSSCASRSTPSSTRCSRRSCSS